MTSHSCSPSLPFICSSSVYCLFKGGLPAQALQSALLPLCSRQKGFSIRPLSRCTWKSENTLLDSEFLQFLGVGLGLSGLVARAFYPRAISLAKKCVAFVLFQSILFIRADCGCGEPHQDHGWPVPRGRWLLVQSLCHPPSLSSAQMSCFWVCRGKSSFCPVVETGG